MTTYDIMKRDRKSIRDPASNRPDVVVSNHRKRGCALERRDRERRVRARQCGDNRFYFDYSMRETKRRRDGVDQVIYHRGPYAKGRL